MLGGSESGHPSLTLSSWLKKLMNCQPRSGSFNVLNAYQAQPPALGTMLTTQKVKSAFELPWNGEVRSGTRLLRGRSWSGEGRIDRVDVSVDGGRSWQPARLREPNIDRAWVRWDLEWDARPGPQRLQARATDARGNTQPDRVPLNAEGYAHWAVVTHPITVS